jgi:uncharacterized protein YjeT (DUF2065 family)
MNWTDLLAALALYLVIEGAFPFASPRNWKQSIAMVAQLSDGQLRIFGLVSMIVGLILLTVARG